MFDSVIRSRGLRLDTQSNPTWRPLSIPFFKRQPLPFSKIITSNPPILILFLNPSLAATNLDAITHHHCVINHYCLQPLFVASTSTIYIATSGFSCTISTVQTQSSSIAQSSLTTTAFARRIDLYQPPLLDLSCVSSVNRMILSVILCPLHWSVLRQCLSSTIAAYQCFSSTHHS